MSPPGCGRAKSRHLRLWPILWSMSAVLLSTAVAQAPLPDYQVKAAFLYHFTQFITWPASDNKAPFVICVLSDPVMGAYLRDLTRDKQVGPRPLRVELVSTPVEVEPCQVLYFAGGTRAAAGQYLKAAHGPGVLTVGEHASVSEPEVMIELFLEDHRIAFRLDLAALERAHLSASSKLIRLSRLHENSARVEGFH